MVLSVSSVGGPVWYSGPVLPSAGRRHRSSSKLLQLGTTFRCSVNMQMSALPMRSAEGRDKDAYLAFGSALSKVATQLRRTKRELRQDKAERTVKDAVLQDGLRGGS